MTEPGPRDLSARPDSPDAATAPESKRGSGRAVRAALVLLCVALLAIGPVLLRHMSSSEVVPGSERCLSVGAAVSAVDGQTGTLPDFRNATTVLGPLTVRRSYDRTLPARFSTSSAARDVASGVLPFVSWKPPGGDHRGAARGKYDRQIRAWAASVPRIGVYATAFHEPENDMTAAEFVAFERHVYRVVKAANSSIHFGPVYMAYWWDPGQPQHYVGNPRAWWPGDGYADFAGLDWYGNDPHPMTQTAEFATWYRVMAPTGLPLVIPEYGQYQHRQGQPLDPVQEQARAEAIATDATWLFAHRQFRLWLYWDSGDRMGDWRLRDRASQMAWQSAARRGCPA